MNITPVILAGGGGQRLWPLSTPDRPKPLLRLFGARSLLQATALRFGDSSRFAPPMLSVGQSFAAAALADMAAIGARPSLALIEPEGRNTAAAIAAAALAAPPEAALLLAPADHAIRDEAALHAALESAWPAVLADRLVVFGVVPDRPATGFGYAVPDAAAAAGQVRPLARFVEKPEAAAATRLIEAGALWNAGMFFGRASAFLAAFEAHAPGILDAARRAMTPPNDGRLRLSPAFAAAPAVPFDMAVMERTDRASVAPLDCGWSDVGDWDAVWRASPRDAAGNVLVGETAASDCRDCYIRGEGAVAAAHGLTDMIVIATPQATLTIPRSAAQEVRRLAAAASPEASR